MYARRICFLVATILVLATTLTVVAAEESNSNSYNDSNSKNKNNHCRLYMAPTTIGGSKNSNKTSNNYGIFTAIDLAPGDTVLANDGPNIPVLIDDRKSDEKGQLELFDNVWWGQKAPVSDQMRFEAESSSFYLETAENGDYLSPMDLQINFGALPNCNPFKSNLETLMPSDGIDYDDFTYIYSQHDPTRGSFSYYTGKRFFVKTEVPSGTELFLDYDSDWEQHGFPRKQDYFSGAVLIRKWMLLSSKSDANTDEGESEVTNENRAISAREFLDSVRILRSLIQVKSPDFQHDYEDEDDIKEGTYEIEQLTSRILSVLPETEDDLFKVYDQAWEIYRYRMNRSDKNDSDNDIDNDIDFNDNSKNDNSIDDLPSVLDVADAMYFVSKPAPKSTRELQETGICLDHIVAGYSETKLELDEEEKEEGTDSDNESLNQTIGRGAMANRFLAKGELIVPVPFLHLVDRSLFEKYKGKTDTNDDDDDDDDDDDNNINGNDELLLNYCFGHSESTLILCPITNAVLVNHCSDRNGRFPCGKDNCNGNSNGNKNDDDSSNNHCTTNTNANKGPNAYYRWASESEWDKNTKNTLHMTLDEMSNHVQQHRMLSMEIVASRDIQEGEEIFIDYGEKWEEAWLKHVQNWQDDKNYDSDSSSWSSSLTAFELNHWTNDSYFGEYENDQDPLFYGDLRANVPAVSKSGRFMATCWYQTMIYNRDSERGIDDEDALSWEELSDQEILDKYAVSVGPDSEQAFEHYNDNPPGSYGDFWPCSVISEEEPLDEGKDVDGDGGDDRYVVRIFPSNFHPKKYGHSYYEDIATQLVLRDYPRSSIKFVTVPYKGDQHHPKAFRHHIEIRDEIFPEQWKNKKSQQQQQ